ncbi:MAG: NUDIX domain-containing protein [Sphaerochaetaceae bacterium]
MQKRITTSGVIQQDDRYFVALRNQGGSIGGMWEFPGGKHRWEESVEQTLKREFYEEFHLTVEVGEHFFSHTFTNKGTTYDMRAYWVTLIGSAEFILKEHQEAKWVTLDELMTLPMADSDNALRLNIKELSLERAL